MQTKHLIRSALFLSALFAATTAIPAQADIILLRDGTSISGSIRRDGKSMVIKADDGRVLTVSPDEVVRITLISTITPAQAAESAWTWTSAQIKNADTLADIIKLHEDFLTKNPDAPNSGQVRASLEEYKKLQAQDGVRFRGKWVPQAQVEVLMRKDDEQAEPALSLYRAGKMKEALEAAQLVVKGNAENSSALIVGGMAAYRQNNLAVARQLFTQLAEVDTGNIVALNNIAVIAGQQKREAEGLLHFTKALAAVPDNRLLLDNITEALNSYKGDRNAAIYKDLLRQFDQAELRMEAALAKKDLYRYGSTWVSQDQLTKATAMSKQVKDQMAALDQQYRDTMQAASTIERDIKICANDYDAAISDINYFNLLILQAQQRGDETDYLITRRDVRIMDLEKIRRNKIILEEHYAKIQLSIPLFKAQAAKLKLQLASVQNAQFTGIQRIMDIGDADKVPPPAAFNVPEAKLPLMPPPGTTQQPGMIDTTLDEVAVTN